MAAKNFVLDQKTCTCVICKDSYNTPRYLPTCDHTFCERCLLSYARDPPQERCPVCKKPNNLAEDTFGWSYGIVRIKESVPELQGQKNTVELEEDVQRKCDPCKERGEAVAGLNFCLDCQEAYCKTCTDSHKVLKMSKNHILINTEDMSVESSHADFFKRFTKCPSHTDTEAEFYCKDHDAVFCLYCFNNSHNQCNTYIVSNHCNDAEKLKRDSEDVMLQMKKALNHLNLLKLLTVEHNQNLKIKMKEVRERIQQVRDQVVTLMDNVVSHVSEVTKQIELENEDKPDENITRVTKIKELIEAKLTLLNTISQYGSERQQFISTHVLKIKVEEIGRKISEEDKRLKSITAELRVADDLKTLTESSDVETLAQVVFGDGDSDHKHLPEVSNIVRDENLVRVEEHKVMSITKFRWWPSIATDLIFTGISMHADKRVILCENCYSRLCLYNPENGTSQEMKLESAYSASQTDDTHIAVSNPAENTITIVTVGDELRADKILKCQNKPKCIVALNGGELAVAWNNPPAFGVIDISGTEIVQKSYFTEDKSGRKFKSFNHLAIDEDTQLVIQPSNKAVYCFDFTGEPVFSYTNPGLRDPQGVALDKCGNIYVCDGMEGSIHKLSPAGELISIFKAGVPRHPFAICCDDTGTGFWLTHYDRKK